MTKFEKEMREGARCEVMSAEAMMKDGRWEDAVGYFQSAVRWAQQAHGAQILRDNYQRAINRGA